MLTLPGRECIFLQTMQWGLSGLQILRMSFAEPAVSPGRSRAERLPRPSPQDAQGKYLARRRDAVHLRRDALLAAAGQRVGGDLERDLSLAKTR